MRENSIRSTRNLNFHAFPGVIRGRDRNQRIRREISYRIDHPIIFLVRKATKFDPIDPRFNDCRELYINFLFCNYS